MIKKPIINDIISVFSYLPVSRKKQLIFLIFLMLISSSLEILTIGSVIPFLTALTSMETIKQENQFRVFFEYFGNLSNNNTILILFVCFAVLIIFTAAVRVLVLVLNARIGYGAGLDIDKDLFYKLSNQTYLDQIQTNSSTIISLISSKVGTVIRDVYISILLLINGLFLVLASTMFLIWLQPVATLIIICSFSLVYILISMYFKDKLKFNSKVISVESDRFVKIIQDARGGVRDIILNSLHSFYLNLFIETDLKLKKAFAANLIISGTPRYIVESIGMVLLLFLGYFFISNGNSLNSLIPIMGAIIIAIQRLLPQLQQIYTSISNLRASRASLIDVLDSLDKTVKKVSKKVNIDFSDALKFKNISFKYNENSNYVFKNLSIEFKKGDIVGITGPTGCGKSTLIDILIGHLSPIEGKYNIDNSELCINNISSWHEKVAHVPQSIFFTDASIYENIAFGKSLNNIDKERVHQVCNIAQISSYINILPHGYNTKIGERGALLSGGQKQRIGIARGLYKNAQVLILDEATSGLDLKTEEKLIDALNKLDKSMTIFMIAHRIESLKNCHYRINLSKDGTFEYINNLKPS